MESQIKDIYKNYKNFWWFEARHDLLSKIFANTSQLVLEIGCASGDNSKCFSNYYGIDISPDSIYLGDSQKLLIATANQLPFASNSFDIIILPDILEHLPVEYPCLSEVNRILKPNGTLLILVPAFQFLWNSHDVLNNHKRRYTNSSLSSLLFDFKIIKKSYWNFFLFLPIVLSKLFNQKNHTGIMETPLLINSLLLNILKLENYLILHNISLPIGISLLYICKKKK